MFVALDIDEWHKVVTAGSDAPEFAKCIYCGGRLKLVGPTIDPFSHPALVQWRNADKFAYAYRHLTNEAILECQSMRQEAEAR